MIDHRPDRIQYYMDLSRAVARRSNCCKRQVGAIVTVDDMIVATGYNGTPRGYTNCFQGGCTRCANTALKSGDRIEECLCLHAEQNCITHAARHGVALYKGHMYCLLVPCITCAKLIINSGIDRLYIADASYATNGLGLLAECHVEVILTERTTDKT